MPGCGGQIDPPRSYLERAFDFARSRGACVIVDEVQTGLGRVGSHFWAHERQGARPDIVTLGKPFGNGHPLAALVTTRPYAEAFANGMEYFNTFGGNPVSCTIGNAVLDVLEEERLQANALRVGERITAELRRLQQKHPWIGDIRGSGLYLGVELVSNRETLEPAAEKAERLVEHCVQRGVLLSRDGPLHNVLKIKPPLVFSERDADEMLAAIESGLEASRD